MCKRMICDGLHLVCVHRGSTDFDRTSSGGPGGARGIGADSSCRRHRLLCLLLLLPLLLPRRAVSRVFVDTMTITQRTRIPVKCHSSMLFDVCTRELEFMRIEMKELRRLKRLARAKERDEAKQSEQKEDPGEEPGRREPEPIPDSEIREPPAAPMIDESPHHRRNSSTDSTATIQRPPRPFPNMFD